MERRESRKVLVRDLPVGGGAAIPVQTMTKTDTRDVDATVRQIEELGEAGAELIRLAVPDREAALALKRIREKTYRRLVADIHFDYRLALLAIEAGVDKLRLNPGNIGDADRVRQVVKAAKERNIPIRIGVNAGSLEKKLLAKYGEPTAEAMVESALSHTAILEDLGFYNTVVSLKASTVPLMIEAYRLMAKRSDYPLHLGVTEAGTPWAGTIRSAVGIGTLLAEGIGDTLRVSLSGEPVEEVRVGYEILASLGLSRRGVRIVSCPTCGRCEIDLFKVVREVESELAHVKEPMDIAIMGCGVNGPGEAREADIGLVGGRDMALIYRKGEIIGRAEPDSMVKLIVDEAHRLEEEKAHSGREKEDRA